MFEHYYRELLHFLTRKLRDGDAAADLAQESYARVYAAQKAGEAVRDPRALLYRTARNLVVDRHRHEQVRLGVESPLPDTDPAEPDAQPAPAAYEPEALAASQQAVGQLVATIEALPPRCREAFLLNRFEGLSYAEVAARMGVSAKAVEQHIRHALDACARARDGS